MSDRNEQIELLLDRYEECVSRDETFSAEDLCRDCPELFDELSKRIQKLKQLDSLIGVASKSWNGSENATETLPVWIVEIGHALPAGRYRPLEFHAQGGLGEVFIAEDVELQRRVALKRMNQQQRRIPESCQRFEVEAMITGRLEHPGIVPVYGLGQDNHGRPVYAMRLIRGETLRDAIRQFHAEYGQQVNSGKSRLAFQQLLRRFLSVCQTIAYAHDQGVIHRDIKPANVMLGKYGETLVVDWGLARNVDAALDSDSEKDDLRSAVSIDATRFGTVKGSPAYMSPEQAAGRSDQISFKSDIYSLGATLYELLTGESPFGGSTLGVLDDVRRGAIRKPRETNAYISAPLEAVCLKAMSLRPDDRYSSVFLLSADIEHWLADEPVSAWPEPWSTRCFRWIRHHHTLVTTAAVACLVLFACLGVAATLLTRKNRDLLVSNQKTDYALKQTELEREKAEKSLETGLEAVRRMLLQVGHGDLSDVPEMQLVQKRILKDAVDFLQGFGEFSNSKTLRKEHGLAQQYLAEIQNLLGEPDEAEKSYRNSIAIQQSLVEEFPNDQAHQANLGITWHNLGRLLVNGDSKQAKLACLKAVAILEPLQDSPQSIEQPLAESFNTLGIIYSLIGEPEKSEANYLQSISMREMLLKNSSAENRDLLASQLAQSRHNLGQFQFTQGQSDEAIKSYMESLKVWESTPDDPIMRRRFQQSVHEVYSSLGSAYDRKRDLEESERYHRKSLVVREELARTYPDVDSYQDNVARSHHNLGTFFQTAGRLQEALVEYEKALAIREPLAARNPDDTYMQNVLAESYVNLAHLQLGSKDFDKAEQSFLNATTLLEKLIAKDTNVVRFHSSLAANEINYGNFLRIQGRIDESLEVHQNAIDRLEPLLQRDAENRGLRNYLLNANGSRAITLLEQARFDEAIPQCDKVVELAEPESQLQHRMWRAVALAHVDPLRALDETRYLSSTFDAELSETDFYNLACVCSLALETARSQRDDADASEANIKKPDLDESTLHEFVAQAIEFLKEAEKAGAFETPSVKAGLDTDTDLDAIRDVVEFQTFLRSLEHKK